MNQVFTNLQWRVDAKTNVVGLNSGSVWTEGIVELEGMEIIAGGEVFVGSSKEGDWIFLAKGKHDS